MKITIRFLCCLFILNISVLSFSGCSEKGSLIALTVSSLKPYVYKSEKTSGFSGVDIDISAQIAKDMNHSISFVETEPSEIIGKIASGEADFAIAALSCIYTNDDSVAFSNVYMRSKQVVLTKKDAGISMLSDINGRKTGILSESSALSYLQKKKKDYPDIITVSADTVSAMIDSLLNGEVDAVIIDHETALIFYMENNSLDILSQELFIDEYAVCVKKDNTLLLNNINKTIERLLREGRIQDFQLNHKNIPN